MAEKKKKLYPFKFNPIAEKVSWGGNYFIKEFKKEFVETTPKGDEYHLTTSDKIGESWELADMGFRDSVVNAGWLKGNSLSDMMETYLERIVGEHIFAYYGRQFPVMIKWLDVRKKTPIMVHPDDRIAGPRYDCLGKTKLWYINDIKPGAKLYMGFKNDITATEFYERCTNGSLEEVLNVIVPRKGESFVIAPGIVHGAVGSMRICEVTESSDLDFKVFNWGQPTENDNVENLGLVAAFDFINYKAYDELIHEGLHHEICSCGHDHNHEEHSHDGCSCGHDHEEHSHEGCSCGHDHEEDLPEKDVTIYPIRNLVNNAEKQMVNKLMTSPEFSVTEMNLTDPLHIYSEKFGSFIIYVCLKGEASIQVPHKEKGKDKMEYYSLKEGETMLIPAEVPDFFLVPLDRSTVLLESLIEQLQFDDPYIDKSKPAKLNDEVED